ncbi:MULTISPECIES: DUF7344 domain-containing protein [Natrialbaceae]|uniref:DUF7344 domain-containing protein n=1 Tax=Natrialbaceae TaxID=1644061 RepID=UPI00207D38B4|nr:hypothetical protein [Natronococcus sp. CG52]
MDRATDNPGAVSLDEVFEQLAARRRRYVLYELQDEDHVERPELARRVAARERGCDVDDVASSDLERMEISLHHRELPQLHEAKFLQYDERQGDVSVTQYFDLVEKYLQLAREDERN